MGSKTGTTTLGQSGPRSTRNEFTRFENITFNHIVTIIISLKKIKFCQTWQFLLVDSNIADREKITFLPYHAFFIIKKG